MAVLPSRLNNKNLNFLFLKHKINEIVNNGNVFEICTVHSEIMVFKELTVLVRKIGI